MKTVVLKFGGSCFGTPADAARNMGQMLSIVRYYIEHNVTPIVVVSAFAGETRRLQNMANAMFSSAKDKDQILAQGEFFAAHIVSQYLSTQAIPASAMLGKNIPVYTSFQYGNADINRIDVPAILKHVKSNTVPVIPGFIGQTDFEDIATLGFDGSDTSAVAIASAVNASECVLFKDVEGVYTANPKLVPLAHKHPKINYADMFLYAQEGAVVIHEKAVKTAWDGAVNLRIKSFKNPQAEGSVICSEKQAESLSILGITYQQESNGTYVSVIGKGASVQMEPSMSVCAKHKTPLNMVQREPHFVKYKLMKPSDLTAVLTTLHQLHHLDDTSAATSEETQTAPSLTQQGFVPKFG